MKGFSIKKIQVNKVPFVDNQGLLLDKDGTIDLSIVHFNYKKKDYTQYNVSPGNLPLILINPDTTEIFEVGLTPLYFYDLDDDEEFSDFIGRIPFDAKSYLGDSTIHVTTVNQNIDITLSVLWHLK